MATLHVRGIPDDLVETLRQRAKTRRRSLSAEVVTVLEQSLAREPIAVERLLERMRLRLEAQGVHTGIPDSVELLREDRAR